MKEQIDSLIDMFIKGKDTIDATHKRDKRANRDFVLDNLEHCLNGLASDELRHEYASYIYWHYKDIPAAFIAPYVGAKHASSVWKCAKPIKFVCTCGECGTQWEAVCDKRSYITYKNGVYQDAEFVYPFHCPNCTDVRGRLSVQSREERQKVLAHLKSMPYKDYLKTDHWKDTRRRALKRAGFKCELCNINGKLHVHHKTYERCGEENNSDLIVLCPNCHAKFHDKLHEVRS